MKTRLTETTVQSALSSELLPGDRSALVGGASAGPLGSSALERSIREWGEKIFALIDDAEPPSLFSARGLYRALMDWAMKDEAFKVQLFRFVDVLPTLNSSSEVARHLTEY